MDSGDGSLGGSLSQQSIWDNIFDDADNEYGEEEESNVRSHRSIQCTSDAFRSVGR